MKIIIDLSESIVDRLIQRKVSPKHCGASLADKVEFVHDNFCIMLEIHEDIQACNALYRRLDMRHSHDLDDDDISL